MKTKGREGAILTVQVRSKGGIHMGLILVFSKFGKLSLPVLVWTTVRATNKYHEGRMLRIFGNMERVELRDFLPLPV